MDSSMSDLLMKSSGAIDIPKVSLQFLKPKQNSLVLTSSVTVHLVTDPPNFNIRAYGVFFCLELLFRHGSERRCQYGASLPWVATIDGLQQGKVGITATLERNNTIVDVSEMESLALGSSMGRQVAGLNDIDEVERETEIIARSRVSFEVLMEETEAPETMHISFPRPNEHLSTGSVDVAMRVGGLKSSPGGEISSYFCTSFVENLNHPTLEKTHNRCIVPENSEIVLSTRFSSGLHGISARLYGSDGIPLSGSASSTSTVFRITEAALGYEAKASHWPNSDGNYKAEDDAIVARAAPNPPLPVIHVVVTSYRSFNRYRECLIMIKSMILHKASPNILHIHLVVDAAGQQFFERELLPLNVSCFRVSFHNFDSVCRQPNEAFLAKYNWGLSAHYSGVAGYCRLYLFEWFHKLGIESIIAIESDQLFSEDVALLWAEFSKFGDRAVLGMPELYKPWRDGRSEPAKDGGKKIGVGTERSSLGILEKSHNGFIGGIVMLNLTRMNNLTPSWEGILHSSLDMFLQKERQDDPEWTLQMNDQDVLNAMAEVKPELFYTISCEWQIQFHAYKEHQRVCDGDWEDIEPTCKASHELGMFICRRPPALVHFMAQSYQTRGGLATMWRSVRDLPWSMALHDHGSTCGLFKS